MIDDFRSFIQGLFNFKPHKKRKKRIGKLIGVPMKQDWRKYIPTGDGIIKRRKK